MIQCNVFGGVTNVPLVGKYNDWGNNCGPPSHHSCVIDSRGDDDVGCHNETGGHGKIHPSEGAPHEGGREVWGPEMK